MKTVTKITFCLLALLSAGPSFNPVHAQGPIITAILPGFPEVRDDDVRIKIFGYILIDPTSVSVGTCPGIIDTDVAGGAQNDFNHITFLVPYATCPGGTEAPVIVTNGAGIGSSPFLVTIPDVVVEPPLPVPPVPYRVLSNDAPVDSVENILRFEHVAFNPYVKQRGVLNWEVNDPLPNPTPFAQFLNLSANIQSDFMTYGASAADFESVMRSMGYYMQVDSITTDRDVGAGKQTTRYHFFVTNPLPGGAYPFLAQGSGTVTWTENIDADFIAHLESYADVTVNGMTVQVEYGGLPDAIADEINELFQVDTPPTVTIAGVPGYEPIVDVRFGTLNGPLPPVTAVQATLNSGPQGNLFLSIPQTYTKYFEPTPLGSSVLDTFYIANVTSNDLTYTTVSVDITGPNANSFSVETAPATGINTGDSTLFTIRFTPTPAPGGPSLQAPGDMYEGTVTVTTDGDSFYSFPVRGSEPEALPVELAAFEALLDGETVALQWTTLSESNNQGFEVQRQSAEAEVASWATLGFVDGSGASHGARSYAFRDEALPSNVETVRYRLKQVDLDGTWAYSSVVEVAVPSLVELALESVYPNPARGSFVARFTVPEQHFAAASLELYDILGRRVRVLTSEVRTARNELTVPVDGLAAGMYLLRLEVGGTVHTRPVVLAR